MENTTSTSTHSILGAYSLGSRVRYLAFRPNVTGDFDPDIVEMYPELTKKWAAWYKTFCTPAAVPGQTAVYLATGAAKDVLKGRYFDCEQDIDFVVRQGRAKIEKDDLYNLKVEFVGLTNDGGTAPAEWEEGNRQ
jgi:hypothetical protein